MGYALRHLRRLEQAAIRERARIREIRMRREPEKVLAEERAEQFVAGVGILVCLTILGTVFALHYFGVI